MKIKKSIQGNIVTLELEKVCDYPRFTLYQIYKLEKDKRIPLYKECLTPFDIMRIIRRGYWVTEEAFE